MKKGILLAVVAGMAALVTLTSNSTGPGSNRTGSKGGAVSCGTCHGSSATSGINVAFVLDSAGTTVNRYKAGMSYTLKMIGTNTTTFNLPKYGMQLSMVSGSGSTAVNAGTFSGLPAGVASHTTSSISILEHNTRLSPATGTGSTGTTCEVAVTWTAPSAGTGTVTAWGIVNAVNTSPSSDDAGDKWNGAHTSFTELVNTTDVPAVAVGVVKFYPNPVRDVLYIDGYSGCVDLCDIYGRKVASGIGEISTANLPSGFYYASYIENGTKQVSMIVK